MWPPGSADTVCPRPPPTLTFDRLTLKLVCESHLRWGTFLPNLGTLGVCVLELFPTHGQTDRRTDKSNAYCFLYGRGHTKCSVWCYTYFRRCFTVVCVTSMTATAPSFDWHRLVGRAAGPRSVTGPSCWHPALGCASNVSRWWWAARWAAAGALGTECWTARRGGRPSEFLAVAESGWWPHGTATAAVPLTTSTASCSSKNRAHRVALVCQNSNYTFFKS